MHTVNSVVGGACDFKMQAVRVGDARSYVYQSSALWLVAALHARLFAAIVDAQLKYWSGTLAIKRMIIGPGTW